MVLDHPGTHSSNRRSLIVVSPCMEWPDKFLSLKLSCHRQRLPRS
jgi:hypothetical protein